MTLFTIEQQRVRLNANLDRETLRLNWWDMLTQQQKDLLVKQQHLEFIFSDDARLDSAGLAWLMNALRDAKSQGIEVHLYNVPPKLLKLAKISDLDSLLSVNE